MGLTTKGTGGRAGQLVGEGGVVPLQLGLPGFALPVPAPAHPFLHLLLIAVGRVAAAGAYVFLYFLLLLLLFLSLLFPTPQCLVFLDVRTEGKGSSEAEQRPRCSLQLSLHRGHFGPLAIPSLNPRARKGGPLVKGKGDGQGHRRGRAASSGTASGKRCVLDPGRVSRPLSFT